MAAAPATTANATDPAPASAEPESPRCEALPDWRYEQIALPPGFAPELPAGVEVLWFAPGMFQPDASDYFTYAFSLDLEAGLPEAGELESLLTQYYRGLMKAVASDHPPKHEAQVSLAADGQSATIEMSDEFTGGGDVTLHLRMSTTGSCLRVLATAQPTDDNWATLARSFECLCASAP